MAASVLGGVGTWTTNWPIGANPGSVIVDPASGDVYVGSSLLLKSSNDGASWFPSCSYGATPLAANAGVVYTTDSVSLLQSLDGGAHCASLAGDAGIKTGYSLTIDPFDANTLYRNEVYEFPRVGVPFFGSVLTRSSDRGASWTDIGQRFFGGGSSAVVSALACDVQKRGTLYAAIIGGVPGLGPTALYKSTDSGTSWTRVNDNVVIGTLAVDPFSSSTLYAAASIGLAVGTIGTFKSIDGGVTFQAINSYATQQVVVDPKHRDRVYIATGDAGVLMTSDGGTTWTGINTGLPSLDIRSLALDPTGTILHASDLYSVYEYQAEDLAALLLDPGRNFSVTLAATDQRTGRTGSGLPIPVSSLFGYFSIPAITNNPGNPEVFVKMLDGTPINGQYWFFYGGLTDLEFTVTVTDNVTGASKTYSKPAGSECGGSDTAAFAP